MANKVLAEYNAEVDLELWCATVLGGRGILEVRPLVKLKKRDRGKRTKLPILFAQFCPLCGAAYGAG